MPAQLFGYRARLFNHLPDVPGACGFNVHDKLSHHCK